MEALIRVSRGAEPGELTHRPETSAVHRGLDAARVRELAGEPEVAVGIKAFEIVGRVQRLDDFVGKGREAALALCMLLRGGAIHVVEPTLLRCFRFLDGHAASSERAITMRCISLVPS